MSTIGNFDHPLSDGPNGDRGWSASRKFASLVAAGDSFFMDSCKAQRDAMDMAMTSDNVERQLSSAVAAQTCLLTAMDTVIQSSCRNAFVSAAKCIQSTGLRNPECKEAQDKLYACTLKEKLAAQQVVLPRRGNVSLNELENLRERYLTAKKLAGGRDITIPHAAHQAEHVHH